MEQTGHGKDPFASNRAVTTAVLGTIGTIFSYLGGATQNDVTLLHSTAVGLVLAGLALAHI